jgi:hypothetical protein
VEDEQRLIPDRGSIGLVTAQPADDSSVDPSVEKQAGSQTNREVRLAGLASLAADQDGVVSRAQLRACGWTDSQIDHEISYGRWHAPAWGVVALQNAPLTYDQRLWLGVLHAGGGAVLTHLTACRRAGLEWKGDDNTIHVLTPKGDLVDPIDGFFFHQTRRPYHRWPRPIGSGPPRLPIDYAALLAAERDRYVRRAIGLLAACVQQQLTTADRLLTTQPRIRKLRNGAVFAVALGDIAGGAQSFAEIDVGHLCERAGLAQPVRQAVRTDGEGRRRYLDCEWELPDGRVVVLEVDGSFHLKVGHWWRDMKRERAVVLSRSTVLRCASIELRLEPWEVMADLRRAGVPPRAVRDSSAVSSAEL